MSSPTPTPTPTPTSLPDTLLLPDGMKISIKGRSMDELRALKQAWTSAPPDQRPHVVQSFISSPPMATPTPQPTPVPTPAAPAGPPRPPNQEGLGESIWAQVNPLHQLEAANKLIEDPYPTLKKWVDVSTATMKQGQKDLEEGRTMLGVSRMLFGAHMISGQQLNKALEQVRAGNVKGAFGTVLGTAANWILPEAVGGLAEAAVGRAGLLEQGVARGMYSKAIGAGKSALPAERVSEAVDRGMTVGKQVPLADEGIASLNQEISNLQAQKMRAVENKKPIPPGDVLKEWSAYRREAVERLGEDHPDIALIDDARDRFLKTIRVAKTKQGGSTYRDIDPREALQRAQEFKSPAPTIVDASKVNPNVLVSQERIAAGLERIVEDAFPEVKALSAEQRKAIDLRGIIADGLEQLPSQIKKSMGQTAAGMVLKGGRNPAGFLLKSILALKPVQARLAMALNLHGANVGARAGLNARITALTEQVAASSEEEK
jgi:hypothetical protein